MSELSREIEVLIESNLYSRVKLIAESQYDVIEVADINKKISTKFILRNKKHAAKLVSEVIKDFALEQNLHIDDVKDFLIQTIENDIELDNMFKQEYELIKGLVLTKIEQEKEEDTREI